MQQMMLEKLDIHMKKNETGPILYTIHKINSKWIKDLNMRPETVKLLGENIEEELHDFGLGNDFFGCDTKSTSNESKK